MSIKFAVAVAALVAASTAGAANLVANGDFEAGNTGFTSGYDYVAPGYGVLFPEALYTVDTDAQNDHPYFTSYRDHTYGEGLYMIVNGAGVANDPVWTSMTIAVEAGRSYDFGAFLSSAYPTSPAQLEFTVTNNLGGIQTLGIFAAPATAGIWSGVSGRFNTGAATLITLSIVNQNIEFSGNDFGIDDISLTAAAVPEPASWAMLLSGFALVGAAARRRRLVPVKA